MVIIFLLKTLLPVVLILVLIRWVIKRIRLIDSSSALSDNNNVKENSAIELSEEDKIEEYVEV